MINKSFPVTLPYLSTLRQPMLKPENKRMANPYLLTFRLPLPTVTNVQFHGKCSAHFQQAVPVSWCAAETNPHIIWRFRYIANESVPRIIHLRCAPVAVFWCPFALPSLPSHPRQTLYHVHMSGPSNKTVIIKAKIPPDRCRS